MPTAGRTTWTFWKTSGDKCREKGVLIYRDEPGLRLAAGFQLGNCQAVCSPLAIAFGVGMDVIATLLGNSLPFTDETARFGPWP